MFAMVSWGEYAPSLNDDTQQIQYTYEDVKSPSLATFLRNVEHCLLISLWEMLAQLNLEMV